MAEIVNLRLARKAKARAAADGVADANRAKFGATKSERTATARAVEQRNRVLDDAKRER